MIAAFGAVSFQDGKGSDWADASDGARKANAPTVAPTTHRDFSRSNISSSSNMSVFVQWAA
jgi:hypothetical protein